jgi:glycosyltransferase A (GT-A) superfamily protein (DUF2064 family)
VDGLAAPADPTLDDAVGSEVAARLRRLVAERAGAWAAAVAPGRTWRAPSLTAAGAVLRGHAHAGPVLLVAPDVPGLDAALAADALGDVAAGVAVTAGMSHDGSPYLVGLARADDDVLELVGRGFDPLVAHVHARGAALGLLRSERRLATAADALALALDPATAGDLARELAPLARRLRDERGGA